MATTTTNKAETKPVTGVFLKERPFEIKPSMCKTQSAGFVNKEVIIWVPDEFSIAWLNEMPEMFKALATMSHLAHTIVASYGAGRPLISSLTMYLRSSLIGGVLESGTTAQSPSR